MGQVSPGHETLGYQPKCFNTISSNEMLHQTHPSDHERLYSYPYQGSHVSNLVREKKVQLSAPHASINFENFSLSVLDNDDSIDPSIPVPKVDAAIVAAQKVIFQQTWPALTPEACQDFPQFTALYDAVKNFNLPNFLGAKKTVPSALNLKQWECELVSYHDREICHFLCYDWPVGYQLESPPVSVQENHSSAQLHAHHVHHSSKLSWNTMLSSAHSGLLHSPLGPDGHR